MGRAARIAAAVRRGTLCPVAVAERALEQAAACNGELGAWLDLDGERALSAARAVADAVHAGRDPGPLAGVPIALKDNIALSGATLTAGSRILHGYRAPCDSTVAERLLAAGAVPLGRTNLDEFAMGASTENSAFGPTRNPWAHDRVPGGSSGGSAAAVASGAVPVALGSETGGSIRQPAALCGITGFKPTWGAVSRNGLVAFASSLDVIGPLAADASDAALVFSVIAGTDPRDATTRPILAGSVEGDRRPADALHGLRIAVPGEFLDDSVDAGVRAGIEAALALLAEGGACVTRLPRGRLPHVHLSIPVYYLLASSEASSNLSRFDGIRYGPRREGPTLEESYASTRGALFGPEVRRRILLGTFALSAGYAEAWYQRALAVRDLIAREFAALLSEFDLIAGPTSPFPAFRLGERSADPYRMYLCDLLTAPVCLAGLPSVSVPAGLVPSGDDGSPPLPVGLSLTGRAGHDHAVLPAGVAFEARRGEPERAPGFCAPDAVQEAGR